MAVPAPKANAMLICDYVITEQGTKKKSLIGVFENIGAATFPFVHSILSVYVKLTDARGDYKFRLELVQLKSETLIGRGEIPTVVTIPTPLMSHELVFNLRGIRFPEAGDYEFRIYANDRIFGQKTFVVSLMDPKNF